jgi:hypothetical protein
MRRVAIIALVGAAMLAAACVRKVELHPDGGVPDSAPVGSDGGDDSGFLPDAGTLEDGGGAPDAAIIDGG